MKLKISILTRTGRKIGAIAVVVSCAWFLLAQQTLALPPRAAVVITFGDNTFVKVFSEDNVFQPVELVAGEAVTIQAQVPSQLSDTPVFVQLLDGGTITSDLTISPSGVASLGYRAGAEPGLYRVLVSARGKSAMLQFEIVSQE